MEEEKKIPKTVKMNDLSFDPALFVSMKTGKLIDEIFSEEGGFPKSTNFILVGDPGVGKSTVSMDIISDLKIMGYSVLFISAEMDRVDLYRYVQRYPKFGDIDILFLGEHLDENPRDVIENQLKKGYDIILIDSFAEVQDTVKEACKMKGNSAEKWLIDLMRSNNSGDNEKGLYTSFLCIQQVTKDGVFLGTNKIKHNTSGMLELRFEKDGRRYAMFSKNRRGGKENKKLYYDLSHSGDVKYVYEDDPSIEEAANAILKGRDNLEDDLIFRL